MARLDEKTSRSRSSLPAGAIPDFPKLGPRLITLPGAMEWNAEAQRWNDLLKQRIVIRDTSLDRRVEKFAAGFRTEFTDINALIEEEQIVRADADGALATLITTVEASFESAYDVLEASIVDEATARATADSAMATDISTVSASVSGLESSVTTIASALATANGYLESRWTLAVTAGPVVTGMTLYSSSGPDTDTSSIVFNTANLRVVSSALSERYLLDANADGFVFGADLLSDNFVTGVSGWRLARTTGILECTDGVFRGEIEATSGQVAGFSINSFGLEAGSGSSYMLIASDGAGIFIGNPSGSSARMGGSGFFELTNSSDISVALLSSAGGPGGLSLSNASGVPTISLSGEGDITASGVITASSFNATP